MQVCRKLERRPLKKVRSSHFSLNIIIKEKKQLHRPEWHGSAFPADSSRIGLTKQRMLGTFNQHLPMFLSNNYWHQSKPTSLHDCVKGLESTDMTCSM